MSTDTTQSSALDTLGSETRTFVPPAGFVSQANVTDPAIYERADKDFEGFWAEHARTLLWRKPFTKVLEWDAPYAKWFADGQLNVSENCLDRHVKAGKGAKVAYHWEGEPGDTRTLTYQDLLDETQRCANALKQLGIRKGDRVAIYMPMVPETVIAMLACARLGAPHTVIFGGFAPEAIADRVNDCGAKLIIKKRGVASVFTGRDVWYHDLVEGQSTDCPAEPMDAEDMLYILYTSGTTGKPKGIVHTTGGYLTGVAATTKLIFDVKDNDVFWCAADVGWVTGHSYIVFGPLANGVTGPALVTAIDQRLPQYTPAPAASNIVVTQDYIPPTVRTRVAEWHAHPHGGPPGQLKKIEGFQTGAAIVHRNEIRPQPIAEAPRVIHIPPGQAKKEERHAEAERHGNGKHGRGQAPVVLLPPPMTSGAPPPPPVFVPPPAAPPQNNGHGRGPGGEGPPGQQKEKGGKGHGKD